MLPWLFGLNCHISSLLCYLCPMDNLGADPKILIAIVQTKMPFGKYRGTLVGDLPVYYLEWMHNKGFPPGKLGILLSAVYEIIINGLTAILTQVKKMHGV